PEAGVPGTTPTGGTSGGTPQPQTLTGGAWDDNLNFDFYQKYLAQMASLAGAPLTNHTQLAPVTGPQATGLDVAIVLDTTGSMGDELAYLQAEIEDIATRTSTRYPGLAPRWGAVFYRDVNDAYLTRSADFTADVSQFKSTLLAQSADGGGDYQESPEKGL